MLVTLSGLDGAGKSTLAEALKADLERRGVSAVIFHMNKQLGLYAAVRALRDGALRLIGARPHEAGEPGLRVPARTGWKSALVGLRNRIVWNKELRRWVDLADLATFHVYRFYVEKVRGDVLIMDRYFYDRMTDIAGERRWRYLRWFSRITPVPDVPVFVEVSPEEAFARKGEFSVEWMTRRRADYRTVFGWVPGTVILSNDDLATAASELKRIVAERGGTPGPRRLAGQE